ncbi:hypothetical protein EGH82_08530 [Vibrio ponticus]|uniref:Alginate biosynthesis protein AlgF n=1 Tax=Vibrio ponticus TaxID=265668 RepID=A0A3N3E1Q0_9VIBR|nr:alginate O-acetyltransferase AlgF [Vibrio ponticus]ROV60663.1 hypothetical protein EGH82_08530 [Vibrio ponticus]
MKFINALFTLSLFFAFQVSADDAALYDPKPSKDSSFVRLVNTDNDSQTLKVNGKKTKPTPAYSASPYIALDAGSYLLTVGGIEKTLTIPSNRKFTLFILNNEFRFVEQAKNASKKAARIAFINISDQPLSLTTQSNKPVFENLGKHQAIEREVNPMKLNFLIKDSTQTAVAELNGVSLKRGYASDIVAFQTAWGTKAISADSEW